MIPPVDTDLGATGEQIQSGWTIVWNRINPWSKPTRAPGIVSVLQRAGALGSIYNRQRMISGKVADLYIRPPVEQFKILDFSVADQAAESVAELAAWVKHEH